MIYDYKCENCNTEETRKARMADRDKQHCEKCGKKLKQIFKKAAMIITGDGGKF